MGTATKSDVSPWFTDRDPCHLALAWRRLGAASDAVHGVTGVIDHDLCAGIEALRSEVWSQFYDRTTLDERDVALEWAEKMMTGKMGR